MPFFGCLEGLAGNDSTIIDQTHTESTSTFREKREIVFLALLEGDSVPTFIDEFSARCDRLEGRVVDVVLVDRSLCFDVPCGAITFESPCSLGIPITVVIGCIFEISVLNQFGIQTSVGSIADILKEDAHEVGRYGFAVIPIHAQCSLDRFCAVGNVGT